MHDIIILGSGPAGFTAGIYAARAGHKTLLVAGPKWGGQLMLTTEVDNFPGFPEGIQGPTLMMNMRKQAERLGVEISNSEFTSADFSKKPFQVTSGGKIYEGKSVIIATGADHLWLNVPGEKELRGKGVSACATCDAFFFRGKNIIVVGGGDSAMEEAKVLANVANSVTIVHRRSEFRASKASQDMVLNNPKVHQLLNAQITEIIGKVKVERVRVRITPSDKKQLSKSKSELETIVPKLLNFKIKSKDMESIYGEMPVDGVFAAIGLKPNTNLYKGINLDPKGYVQRTEVKDEAGKLKYFTATNVDGVFTAGDVHDYRYRQAITASAYGCMSALDCDRWLNEK
jgi:thioredoxin reductase (NADPH)